MPLIETSADRFKILKLKKKIVSVLMKIQIDVLLMKSLSMTHIKEIRAMRRWLVV